MNTRGIRNASPSGRSRVLAGKDWEFATHSHFQIARVGASTNLVPDQWANSRGSVTKR
jgi:hypothetical protein